MRSRAPWLTVVLAVAGCGGGGGPAAPTTTPPIVAASPSPTPAPSPSPSPSPSPDPSPTSGVLRRATLRGANGHSAMGTARIEREGARHMLTLSADFRIDSGNTDVYLARSPGRVDGNDLNLGELRRLTGAQSYAMPDDGGQYGHVVLWCRPFRVPIGLGDLQ